MASIPVRQELQVRRSRTLIAFNIFNVSNSNTPDAYLQSYGPTYRDAVSVTRARLFKVSAQLDF